MEPDRSVKDHSAKVWDPVAAANAAAGVAAEARAAMAGDKAWVTVVVLAAAVGKADLRNQTCLRQTIKTKTNLSKERRAAMSLGDRTGPMCQGQMTGRDAGYCAGFNSPGYLNRGPGFGFGPRLGRGGGRGCRHWFYATGLTGWQRGAAQ